MHTFTSSRSFSTGMALLGIAPRSFIPSSTEPALPSAVRRNPMAKAELLNKSLCFLLRSFSCFSREATSVRIPSRSFASCS